MPDSATQTTHRPETSTGRGEPDAVAHIVMREDQMRGYLTGEPIEALCGKVWVPTRDYAGLPVCERCVKERDRILSGMKRLN